jgi:chromosome segregation ATPase
MGLVTNDGLHYGGYEDPVADLQTEITRLRGGIEDIAGELETARRSITHLHGHRRHNLSDAEREHAEELARIVGQLEALLEGANATHPAAASPGKEDTDNG